MKKCILLYIVITLQETGLVEQILILIFILDIFADSLLELKKISLVFPPFILLVIKPSFYKLKCEV